MKIALVEDEKKLAEVIKSGLVAEGYSVDLFLDGQVAEDQLKKDGEVYDVIILDLGMPHRDGFQICQSLREINIQTPLLILTARDSTDDKVKLLNSGADDFLTKPFDFEELLARIRALLRRPRQSVLADLSYADLMLSPKTRLVFRGAKQIILTPKEFVLLQYLLQNPGRVISRTELTSHLWPNECGTSNNLDAQIKNLREKVDHDYENTLIQTIRGMGFTITEALTR